MSLAANTGFRSAQARCPNCSRYRPGTGRAVLYSIRGSDSFSGSVSCRLAHYSKGACASVGANAAAAVLLRMEREAGAGALERCAESLVALDSEVARLRAEIGAL